MKSKALNVLPARTPSRDPSGEKLVAIGDALSSPSVGVKSASVRMRESIKSDGGAGRYDYDSSVLAQDAIDGGGVNLADSGDRRRHGRSAPTTERKQSVLEEMREELRTLHIENERRSLDVQRLRSYRECLSDELREARADLDHFSVERDVSRRDEEWMRKVNSRLSDEIAEQRRRVAQECDDRAMDMNRIALEEEGRRIAAYKNDRQISCGAKETQEPARPRRRRSSRILKAFLRRGTGKVSRSSCVGHNSWSGAGSGEEEDLRFDAPALDETFDRKGASRRRSSFTVQRKPPRRGSCDSFTSGGARPSVPSTNSFSTNDDGDDDGDDEVGFFPPPAMAAYLRNQQIKGGTASMTSTSSVVNEPRRRKRENCSTRASLRHLLAKVS